MLSHLLIPKVFFIIYLVTTTGVPAVSSTRFWLTLGPGVLLSCIQLWALYSNVVLLLLRHIASDTYHLQN